MAPYQKTKCLSRHAVTIGPSSLHSASKDAHKRAFRASPGTLHFALRGCATRSQRRSVVGLGRLELPTSRLSSARSNQLSYKPLTLILILMLILNWRSFRARVGVLPAHRPSAAKSARCIAQRKPLARVRPRRKRNEDGEIPPMELNNRNDCWPLIFLKRSDRRA
jgi:hypothetical protein